MPFLHFFQFRVFWQPYQNVVKRLFLVHISTVCQFWSLTRTKRLKKWKFSFENLNQNKLYFPILVSDQKSIKIISPNRIEGGFFWIFLFIYDIQHCFICRPSDSTVSEDAGIEPMTLSYIYIKNVPIHHDEWLDWWGTKYSLSLVSWWATDGSNFQLGWVGGGRGHKINEK